MWRHAQGLLCGVLPLGFGGQAGAHPAGVGIGFVVRQVHGGLRAVQRLQAGQGKRMPGAVHPLPVKRVLQALRCAPVPAFCQPQGGVLIAAALDKRGHFSVGDQARRQRVGVKVHAVARAFIVKRKTSAFVADVGQSVLKRLPCQRRRRRRHHHGSHLVSGPQWVG
ncbi:hypothetical protein D3C71_1299200 [compost metagenome]